MQLFWGLVVAGTPLLAFPVALIWGLKTMLWAVLAVIALMLFGPPLAFGIAALFYGEPPFETAGAVFMMLWHVILTIGGWMMMWSLIYGGTGAAIRFGWLHWKSHA